jgi:hypothetical protein
MQRMTHKTYKETANDLYNLFPILLNKVVMPYVKDEDGEEYLDLDHIDVINWMYEYLEFAEGLYEKKNQEFDYNVEAVIQKDRVVWSAGYRFGNSNVASTLYAETSGQALAMVVLMLDEN